MTDKKLKGCTTCGGEYDQQMGATIHSVICPDVIAWNTRQPAPTAEKADVVEAVARIIDPAAWDIVDEHAPYVARHTIPFEKARLASLEKARAAIAAMQARSADDAEHRLRMIVSHATGGNLQYDPAMSVNAICCEITAMRNKVWKHAQEAMMDSLTPRPAELTEDETQTTLAQNMLSAMATEPAGDAAWVCHGIPDDAIEAGMDALENVHREMQLREESETPELFTDWDEGMMVAAIYKAMAAKIAHPALGKVNS